MTIKGIAAISGVGSSKYYKQAEVSLVELITDAFNEALDESGLKKEDIDGLTINFGSPLLGIDYDNLSELLGLQIRFVDESWSHGRFIADSFQRAASAVHHGLANNVLVMCAINWSAMSKVGGDEISEEDRTWGGPHLEVPYHGLTSPGAGAALGWQRYLNYYNEDRDKLAGVALGLRKNALQNPNALLSNRPITKEDYLQAPFIFEPLRRLDYCLMSDGAACAIVTTPERARVSKKEPVYILGFQSLRGGQNEYVFGRPGLGMGQQPMFNFHPQEWDKAVFEMAGLTPDDIDAVQIYDSFSPFIIYSLERYGYCPPGEALNWIDEGRSIEITGKKPVNTSGGHIAEAYIGGLNHIVESVRQIRKECGERQLNKADAVHFIVPGASSLILGNSNLL